MMKQPESIMVSLQKLTSKGEIMTFAKPKVKHNTVVMQKNVIQASLRIVKGIPGMYESALDLADQSCNFHDASYYVMEYYGDGWDKMAKHFGRVVEWLQSDEGKAERGN